MKYAIQRLVRGDDGLTKVIYVDLVNLQQIDDLTGYRIVNSGELEPEPVASVDQPDVPSTIQPPPTSQSSRGENDGRDTNTPYAPNQTLPGVQAPSVTAPTAIRTPESRVPAAVSPPAAVEPEAPAQTDLGPLGGIRTAQGSILPELDYSRFDQNIRDLSRPSPTSIAGEPNVSQLERNLDSRNELENIKDASNPLGPQGVNPNSLGTMVAGRPETVGSLPAARQGTTIAGRPEVTGSLPAARQTTIAGRPEVVGSLPAARESVPDVSRAGIGRNAYDTSYGVDRGAINAGIMATDDMPTRPSDTLSARQAGLPDISRNAYDMQKQAERVASGLGTTVAGRPDARLGSLPAAKTSMSPTTGTKDDWAGPDGTTKVSVAEFDRPSATSGATRSVAGKVVDKAKETSTNAQRTTGFAAAGPTPGKARTTSFIDAAGYSQTDVTGLAAARNNNPGNIETGPFARSQEGYLGAAGGVASPDGRLAANERFAVFDTKENGLKAQKNLIEKNYMNKTITQMAKTYAPTEYSATGAVIGATSETYAKAMADSLGVDPDTTKLSDLTPSQRQTMIDSMLDNQEANTATTSRVSLTSKGLAARDNYTGLGTGSDTPSERNASSRPSSGTQFGSGGSRGVASNIGRNDSAGPGRGSSPGGPTSSGGIGRASPSTGGSGKSATSSPGNSVSGASRSTAGKGGASPSAKSGGQSGAAQSGTSGKTSKSSSIGAGGSEGASQRSGGAW
jgi:hypothetical protein